MKLKAPDGKTVVDPYDELPVEGVVDTDQLVTMKQISLIRLYQAGSLIEAVDPAPSAPKKAGGDK
jgi:hypothetical protein